MRSFAKQIAVILLVLWSLGGYPLYLWRGTDVLVAAGVGCAICALNAIAGAGLALWGLRRDHSAFMKVVFGGVGARFIIVLIFFFVALKLVKLHVFALTLSLFFFYLVFQIIEIRFLVKQVSDNK